MKQGEMLAAGAVCLGCKHGPDSHDRQYGCSKDGCACERYDRNPRMEPCAGDVFHRWERNYLVTQNTMGAVFVQPSLSSDKAWIGILFFREWAQHAEVVHKDPQ